MALNVTGTQTEVGESDNTYELNWNGTAKEKNYRISSDSTVGKLTVTAKPITDTTITVSDPEATIKYDGQDHKETLTVSDSKTSKTLVQDTDYELTYKRGEEVTEDFKNVGTITITVKGIGNYAGENTVTKSYEITKRIVELTSATATKVYDGTALKKEEITISEDGFAEGEGATYSFGEGLTNVGEIDNGFSYILNEGTSTNNYTITTANGKLTVTKATAEIKNGTTTTSELTKTYYKNNKGEVKLISDGVFSEFNGLEIWNTSSESWEAVDTSNYKAESGSTIITLYERYLQTLDYDKDYKFRLVYKNDNYTDSYPTVTLKVRKYTAPSSSSTTTTKKVVNTAAY